MKKLIMVLLVVLLMHLPVNTPANNNRSLTAATIAINAQDNTFSNKAAGIQFTLPRGWKGEPKGDLISVTSPSSSIIYSVVTIEEAELDAAIDATFEQIEKSIQNAEVTNKGKEGQINDLKYWEAEGKGKINGVAIDWDVHIMVAKKPLIFFGLYLPGYEKDGQGLSEFINSIKKIK